MDQFNYNRFKPLRHNWQIFLGLFTCSVACFALFYAAVFGRALGQNENHAGIFLALPKVIFGREAVLVDAKTYLAQDPKSFIAEIEKQGFEFTEQMGAGYFFKKDGENYISIGRMYSSGFMLFSVPEK